MTTPESSLPPPETRTEPQSTRKSILVAASRVFLAKGYEGSSMDMIASESGAGRRTVYNHFKSKKSLFDATVALLWESMPLNDIISRLGVANAPDQALREIGHAIADFWAPKEAVAFVRLIIGESDRFPELAQSFFTFGRGPARHVVTDYLGLLDQRKILDVPDPELAAAQFISLVTGAVLVDRLVTGDRRPLSKKQQNYVVEEAVQLILSRYQVRN